ncbi:MAG: porin [Geminicoccaceae bacterium]
MKKFLLGTSAIAGAALLTASQANAQDFDLTLGGFARFGVGLGDVEEESGEDSAREHNFFTDSEIIVNARSTSDSGLEYGGTIEFETDTNSEANTDEAWIFLSGGFGEVRLGSEDGAVDNSKVGGFSVAAGTGGIDGDGFVGGTVDIVQTNSGDANKIRYYTPVIGGLQFGASYTPDVGAGGDVISLDDTGDIETLGEGAIVYEGAFSGVDITASVVGSIGGVEEPGDDDFTAIGGGIQLGFAGFSLAGAYFQEDLSDVETEIINAGIAASLGPANLSFTYGFNDVDDGGEPELYVISADTAIAPGAVLKGDIAIFDNDTGDDDDGVTGVIRLDFSF